MGCVTLLVYVWKSFRTLPKMLLWLGFLNPAFSRGNVLRGLVSLGAARSSRERAIRWRLLTRAVKSGGQVLRCVESSVFKWKARNCEEFLLLVAKGPWNVPLWGKWPRGESGLEWLNREFPKLKGPWWTCPVRMWLSWPVHRNEKSFKYQWLRNFSNSFIVPLN